jgi:hypothetical protein
LNAEPFAESVAEGLRQAEDLIAAGWLFDLETLADARGTVLPVWSWAWRSPVKPGQKRGRRWPSTNQAWRALKRGAA